MKETRRMSAFLPDADHAAQLGEHGLRLLEDVSVRERQERIAPPAGRALALEVGLPRFAGAVIAEALLLPLSCRGAARPRRAARRPEADDVEVVALDAADEGATAALDGVAAGAAL